MSESNEKRPVDQLRGKLESELEATREAGERLQNEKLVKRWEGKRSKGGKEEKSKNKTNMLRNIILGVLALAVLIAALIGVSMIRTPEEIEQQADAVKRMILDKKATEVVSMDISIRETGEELSFYKDNSRRSDIEVKEHVEKWFFRGYEDSNVDLTKVKNLVTFASGFKSESIIREGVSEGDLAEFGLDSPRATLSVEYDDGTGITILLGRELDDGSTNPPSYFMAEGDSTVHLGANFQFYMMHDSAFYISSQTVEFDGGEFSYLRYAKRGGEEVIIELEGYDDTDIQNYRMKAPYEMGLGIDVAVNLQEELSALGPASIAEANAKSLSKYGLLEPSATIEMRSQLGQEYKLLIGDAAQQDDGGFTYMKIEGDDNVYLMYTSTLDFLNRDPQYMIDGYVLAMMIDKVEAVEFSYKGERHSMNILREEKPGGDGLNETFFLDGEEIPDKEFRAIYSQVISMEINGQAVKEFDREADAVLEVTMIRNDGAEPFTIEFLPYDLDRYVLRDASGSTSFVMLRDGPEKVITMIERVKQGLPAREYDGNIVTIDPEEPEE